MALRTISGAASARGRPSTTTSNQKPAHASLPERVDRKGNRHQAHVERQALTSHVATVQTERQAPGARFVHLREPGETGQHAPAEIVPCRHPTESRDIGLGQRTWSDGAHVSSEDVDELRELIEARRAQHPPDPRDSAVPHRAELEDGERSAPSAEALLSEQNRPPVLQEDGACDDRHGRRKREQAAHGPDEIEQTL